MQEHTGNNISNNETYSNGKSVEESEKDQDGLKSCRTVLSIEGMPKLSVSSQTETAILNQQKTLRDTLSKSSGTAV